MSNEELELRSRLQVIEREKYLKEWGLCASCKNFKPHEMRVAYQCKSHRVTSGDSYYTNFEATCSEWPSIKSLENKHDRK